jgi:hypothetical protein
VKGRIVVAVALVVGFLAWTPKGEQVRLITLNDQTCCILSYGVVDIDRTTALTMKWMPGYTAWRKEGEIEIRDPVGNVVVKTPGRYRISPTWPDWAVGDIVACPDCGLGGGPL